MLTPKIQNIINIREVTIVFPRIFLPLEYFPKSYHFCSTYYIKVKLLHKLYEIFNIFTFKKEYVIVANIIFWITEGIVKQKKDSQWFWNLIETFPFKNWKDYMFFGSNKKKGFFLNEIRGSVLLGFWGPFRSWSGKLAIEQQTDNKHFLMN